MGAEMLAAPDTVAMLGQAANAWNAISWEESIPFLIVLIGLYWVKVKIDSSVGLSKKKGRQLKNIIKEAIEETK
jgi:hypothetical protein|tara:strand:- start:352 stop:573 length:222 start_codon:yes stop_codon:yes gene_type:complete